jgi:hypothetical protein
LKESNPTAAKPMKGVSKKGTTIREKDMKSTEDSIR